MPPPATTTAWADKLNSPIASVERADAPRQVAGLQDRSRRRVRRLSSTSSAVTWCRARIRTRRECSTRCANGSTRPGPVPQATWNRGTELPWPGAV